MKLCMPIERNIGLESPISYHFGSAPLYMVVDTESREMSEIVNRDQHHAHGACSPLKVLGETPVDAIVVGGIGAGALLGLNRAGLKVFKAQGKTIADNLICLSMNQLPELSPTQVCGGHGSGHGCGH